MTCIVLDRDGVINKDSNDYVKSAEEWAPIDGSLEAIATLTARDTGSDRHQSVRSRSRSF